MKVRLDVNTGLVNSFAIAYKFTDNYDAREQWTNRFKRFKQKEKSTLYGAANLMKTAAPLLVNYLGLDKSKTVFIPALSSSETVALEEGFLSIMARGCAKVANVGFVQDAITKKAHSPLHFYGNKDERREILGEANYKSVRIKAENILIFDDFITRGETLSHIARAIHKANTGIRVYGVCLGKNESRIYQRERFNKEISNDRVPKEWDALWEQGEKQYRRGQRKD